MGKFAVMNWLTAVSLLILVVVPVFEFTIGTGLLEIPIIGGLSAIIATILLHQRHRLNSGIKHLFAATSALVLYHAVYSLFIFENLSHDSRVIFAFSIFAGMAVYFLSYEYASSLRRTLTKTEHFLKIFAHSVLVLMLLLSLIAFGAIVYLIYQSQCCFGF